MGVFRRGRRGAAARPTVVRRPSRSLTRQGRIDVALIVLAIGLVVAVSMAPERRNWVAAGFLYAAAAEIAWVDENLEGFKGRVTRENWVAQAKVVVGEGEAALLRRIENDEF